MASDTGSIENSGNLPRIPTPEQIGFQQIDSDVLAGVTLPENVPYHRMASLGIDKTVDRRTRWEKSLRSISTVALDVERRKNAIANLNEYASSERERENGDPQLVEVVELVRSVIANFEQPAALKLALQRGAREPMQDSIARTGDLVGSHFSTNPDLANIIVASLELTRELYAQGHEGRGYQTAEQKHAIEEARKRTSKLKIE